MEIKKSNEIAGKYLVLDNANEVASFIFQKQELEPYSNIKNGKWLSNFDYVSIYNIQTGINSSDLVDKIITLAINTCKKKQIRSLRSHIIKNNDEYKTILKSHGFKHCGFVNIEEIEYAAYELLVIPYVLGDRVMLKKEHPCGGNTFKISRLGMDIKLECEKCGSIVWLKRSDLNKRVKKRL
ncbi:DUF951 domain-containing protein [Criibacterium bergeronii]|uniref:DUF951 domain-containing protein n=1 Tax=Criibacterium bergeronii TaxID=1871336 RepID=A0A552UXK8_9FIRM|nr:DUF951 domain-containing protein [Criibacterium bergeronii]TRW22937.1 DUF951 domain-containing protein [Criibacterium bergeronii]